MKSFIYKCFIGGSVALSMTLSSCLGDLDLKPIDDNVIQLSDFKDNPQYYTQLLAKVYAGLAVSGQEGPAGNPIYKGSTRDRRNTCGPIGICRNCLPTKPC